MEVLQMCDQPTAWSRGNESLQEIMKMSSSRSAAYEGQERIRRRKSQPVNTSINSHHPHRTVLLPNGGYYNSHEGAAKSRTSTANRKFEFSATSSETPKQNSSPSDTDRPPPGDGESDPPGHPKKRKVEAGTRSTRLFACPYMKYDPVRYGSCSKTVSCGFSTILSLKRHLLRQEHPVDPSGTRTGLVTRRQTPGTALERSFGPSDIRLEPAIETASVSAGLSPSKAAAIRGYCEKNASEEWYRIWDIVFPDVPRPASPYIGSHGHMDNLDKHQPPKSEPDLVPIGRRLVSIFDADAAESSGDTVSLINDASAVPSSAVLKETKSFRNMSDLVLGALQILEARVEIVQCQKITRPGGRKTPSRKRGRQSEDQQPQQQQQQTSKRHTGSKKQKSQGSRQDGTNPPNDDDPDDSGPEGDHDNSAENTEHRFLACPFLRKDPEQYAACAMLRLRRIRDVKQHMRRGHSPPAYYCPICWKTFQGTEDRDRHIVERSCDAPAVPGPHWITQQQVTLLEGRVSNGPTEDQWFSVWDIVCPGLPHPTPAFCFLGRMVEDTSAMRRGRWEEEGRHIVEDLVSQQEALLQQPLTEESRNLVLRCIIDAVSHVLEQPDVTRAGRIRWEPARSETPNPQPQTQTRAHVVLGDDSDPIRHQTLEMQDYFLQNHHTHITDQNPYSDGMQLGGLATTPQWESVSLQPIDFNWFDAADLNILDSFVSTFGDEY
ncbi:hypothetical protein CFIO01_02775 [Colletotrichum fioriniae PJ7]|uniref:C2H2-type domain-containing protein n=1 Tax=Colletotrichum fioriniae PJ7 TaxID=1445577 RepID=A0A010R702_9PEZI|nr:hypothetical protein CFIO01_02775 [Colletotrichum fioriniae PJ7]